MKHFLFISILIPFLGLSQNLAQAKLEFNRYEYAKSAQILNEVASTNKLSTSDLKMLTYSNYVTGDWEKTLANTDDLIERKEADPMHYLMRADALKALKKYDESIIAYNLYKTKDTTDNVSVDISSCKYLPTVSDISGMWTVNDTNSNTRKADARFLDQNIGLIYFHEIGVDSIKKKIKDANTGELMLSRPFIERNGNLAMIRFPESMDLYGVTSLSKDPNSNLVVFTAFGLLEKKVYLRSPQLYTGTYNADSNTVIDTKIWSNSHPELGESTAFGCFVPNSSTLLFSLLKPDSTHFSDFYTSKYDGSNWSTSAIVKNINTFGEEEYPIFINEYLYFSSTGRDGYGALDVYQGKFDLSSNSVNDIKNLLAPINTASDELYYLGDADTSYITSNRFGSNAEDDVWKLIDQDRINKKSTAYADSVAMIAILDWNPPKVYFEYNSNIPDSSYSFFGELTDILQKYPNIMVEVVGYTDIRGSEEYNNNLSLERARFVKNQLIEKGISSDRISEKGEGKELATENSNYESSGTIHHLNRFVQIVLVKAKK